MLIVFIIKKTRSPLLSYNGPLPLRVVLKSKRTFLYNLRGGSHFREGGSLALMRKAGSNNKNHKTKNVILTCE